GISCLCHACDKTDERRRHKKDPAYRSTPGLTHHLCLCSPLTTPCWVGTYNRAADRYDEHITSIPSALRGFKEGGTRSTKTRHGAHTGSFTKRRSHVPLSTGNSARKVDRASR